VTATAAVRLHGVTKSYEASDGPSVVLEDLDLTIAAGEKVSLVGCSGSGKSTLLALIAGLLRPDAGRVEIDGVALTDLDDAGTAALRARHIGIALQSDNLVPFLTARENVDLALGFARRPRPGRRADDLLERMGVGHRRNHRPRHLSGGEAQRVAMAVALANEPAVLLADEMVAQLDSVTAGQVVDAVLDTNMAVLFVTHDVELADRAERRLRMSDRSVETR
jgi:putative ABC transport system ATP-binding protein